MDNFTAKQILNIPISHPEEIFSNDIGIAKDEFRELGKKWHPDVNKATEATQVFQHLTELYTHAKKIIGTPNWKKHSSLLIKIGSTNLTVNYFKQMPFELGQMYIGNTEVLFAVDKQHSDLYDNAVRMIKSFKYASPRMETEVSRFLPKNVKCFKTDSKMFILMPKDEDVLLLDDVSSYFNHELDPRHVAWIQSTVHNLSCYFRYAKIMHGDISSKTLFISPSKHTSVLLGGWWYSTKVGNKIKALPKRSIEICPPSIMNKKLADTTLDLQCIRAMGRELLGDKYGSKLKRDPRIPAPLEKWMNGASSGDAITDYTKWKEILVESFGKPKFMELTLDADTLYKIRK